MIGQQKPLSINDLPVGPAPNQIPQVQDIANIVASAATVLATPLAATTDPQNFAHDMGRTPTVVFYSITRGTDLAGGVGPSFPAGLVTVAADATNVTVTLGSANDGGMTLSFLLL